MDFVPVTYSKEEKRRTRKLVLGMTSLGAGLATVPTVLVFLDGVLSAFEAIVPGLGVGTLFATLMLSVATPAELASARNKRRNEELKASLNRAYGLRISDEDLKGLSYPKEHPSSDFEVFGFMLHREQVSESSFVELKVYLVWMDGRFQLSKSRDGKNFRELKPAQRVLSGFSAPSDLSEEPAPPALHA